jgi:hypothetical protein
MRTVQQAEQSTKPVGLATPHALRIGEQLVIWGRRDRAARPAEAAKFMAVLEGHET